MIDISPSGKVYQVFPNKYQTENFIQAKKVLKISGSEFGYNIRANGKEGLEYLKVIASNKPLDLFNIGVAKPLTLIEDPENKVWTSRQHYRENKFNRPSSARRAVQVEDNLPRSVDSNSVSWADDSSKLHLEPHRDTHEQLWHISSRQRHASCHPQLCKKHETHELKYAWHPRYRPKHSLT